MKKDNKLYPVVIGAPRSSRDSLCDANIYMDVSAGMSGYPRKTFTGTYRLSPHEAKVLAYQLLLAVERTNDIYR